jgi:hypothetical protein
VETLVLVERGPVVARRRVQLGLLREAPHAHAGQLMLGAQRPAVIQAGLRTVQSAEAPLRRREGEGRLGDVVRLEPGRGVVHVPQGLLGLGVPAQADLNVRDGVALDDEELAPDRPGHVAHALDGGPCRVDVAGLVLGVREVVQHEQLPGQIADTDGDALGLPVAVPGRVGGAGFGQ